MDYTKIDELQDKLKSLRPLTNAELDRVTNEFIIENTYDSNAIEGSTLTLRETALILQEGITIAEKPIKEHLEAIGHKDAFEYIKSLANRNEGLTESVIKNIHSLVLMDDATNRGIYRSVPVKILGATHVPVQPYLIQVQMEKLLVDYKMKLSECHIIESIAEFHLRFEGIHPFIDGNGRTGRLILNLELIKSGLLPINIKFADRRRYYDCFEKYYEKNGDIKSFVELILEYEVEELTRYINILK